MSWRSWRARRAAYKLAFPLSLRKYRRHLKRSGLPDLPGIWKTSRHFYSIAQEYVTEHEDGWSVTLDDPGHRFIAWEMAVRYEAASREIEQNYVQICDGPSDEEWAERIRRIRACLDERERLSEIEQAAKPMFSDPGVLGALVSCPRPRYQPPPERPILEELADEHLS